MTSEELATVGVSPTGVEIHESENIQSRVDDPASDTVPSSGSREEGEIGFGSKSGGEEDLTNIDANLSELVTVKSVKSYPLAFVFGESKVTAALIKECEEAGFFSCWRRMPSLRRTSPCS
jgi:hypothetical protein